jgi:HD-GYP domain-containing protein (c-di-GMP phosphodiesterase class II)
MCYNSPDMKKFLAAPPHGPTDAEGEDAMSDEKKIAQLRTLVEVSALISSTLETKVVRQRAMEAATLLLGAEVGSLLLVDHERNELYFEVALGEKGETLKEIRLKMGEGIAGWVAEHGEPLLVEDVRTDPRFFSSADRKSAFVTRNMVCAPVRSRDRTLGVLQAINKRDGAFTQDDLEGLVALAQQVAPAIENANLFEQLRDTFFGTALALAESLEKRDTYTGGHTRRVSGYSMIIGRELALSVAELEELHLSAILHDIGKIGVRDDVLLKQGRLDADELACMNMHPHFGAEILHHVKYLKQVVPGVKCHHEMFNGSGYPDGLHGDEIPLSARIIAVADSFDAMTTDRPYRKALSFDVAFGEIEKCSGTQFDPLVVEAFLSARRGGKL